MLEARKAERDPALWAAAADLGEPVRSYVARLMAIQDQLDGLPD